MPAGLINCCYLGFFRAESTIVFSWLHKEATKEISRDIPDGFRRKPESSECSKFWMPIEDPVFNGDQARHDELETFYEGINPVNLVRKCF